MKRFVILVLFATVILMSCEKEPEELVSPIINGLTFYNYPKMDGSTSTEPLNMLIACKLLGVKYQWEYDFSEGVWGIEPKLSYNNSAKIKRLFRSSTTHQSFINLIDKEEDLILVARTMSSEEKSYADSAGVGIIETPIALDAFVFIVHPDNPIQSLTIKQIQDIYSGKIFRWEDVGGNNASIKPYVRNANSGSQELMESLVMKELDMKEFFDVYNEIEYTMHGMTGAIMAVSGEVNVNSICYTVHYYKEQIVRTNRIKSIAIEGIIPNRESIVKNSYPLVAPVYAVIRSDLDKSSMAYKVYEWLQTPDGKKVINESGYIAN